MPVVRPYQMPALVAEGVESGIEVLSLDCFDTLIWRRTQQPTDVFAAAGLPLRPMARINAEHETRMLSRLAGRSGEVSIEEIYARALRDPAGVAAAVDAELAAEKAQCFAFAPTVELIRAARRAGLRVIVVSDTYLSQRQLRDLIAACAGEDVVAAIERVYCSCEHGLGKAGGLLRRVLDDLGLPTSKLMHVGDNPIADYEAATKLGIAARRLEQFDPATDQQLRLEANVGALFDPLARHRHPVHQPHRALLGRMAPSAGDGGQRLGYSVLGPVLLGFSRWLHTQAAQWKDGATPPKLLFLMRDGHLPMLAYKAFAGEAAAPAFAVELSRFTAVAASLRSLADIDDYLAPVLDSQRLKAMARQLLFTDTEAAALAREAARAGDPLRAFADRVRSRRSVATIVERSARFRRRLVAHLKRVAGVTAGDRLMLVDLGYAGTVQDRVEPWLREELGVQVRGCYLLLRDRPDPFGSKCGFVGADGVDGRAVDTLCHFIAIFEQLCAATQGSVIDYGDDGQPVRKASGLASRQSALRGAAQAGCIRFIEEAVADAMTDTGESSVEAWRQAATAALARLLFLPSADELELFKGFEHDVNMGVDDKELLFDQQACKAGLRDRGLHYINDSPRPFLGAELRAFGLPLSLTLLAQHRFGMDLRHDDFGFDRIRLPIMVANGRETIQSTVDAHPTHDGYYVARIPVGRCEYSIGVLFGRDYASVQLASATLTRSDRLLGKGDVTQAVDVLAAACHEAAEAGVDGLLRLASPAAFSYFEPPALDRRHSYTLNLVFRPLQRRAVGTVPTEPRTTVTL